MHEIDYVCTSISKSSKSSFFYSHDYEEDKEEDTSLPPLSSIIESTFVAA